MVGGEKGYGKKQMEHLNQQRVQSHKKDTLTKVEETKMAFAKVSFCVTVHGHVEGCGQSWDLARNKSFFTLL